MHKVALLITAATVLSSANAWAQASPYAGQESRPIKSLSAADIHALNQGQGMGFAKAAELNGYPGPMHVLEHARRLDLTPEQRSASEKLMAEHKARAREMGARLIDAERALDRLFAERQADAATVDAATRRVGELQAALRAEHLKTHLAQTALLDAQQIERYQVLRGYARASSPYGDNEQRN
jgi:Spy/CpxP family protein refolding chaperone